jgi:hypothetical protein
MSMTINNAFSSGVMGLQKATSQMDTSASQIAQQTASDQTTSTVPRDSLPDALLQLKSAELQGKASAEVISRSDKMLGSLLDIHV